MVQKVLFFILFLTGCFDLKFHRIPNWAVLSGIVLGIIITGYEAREGSVLLSVGWFAGIMILITCLMLPFVSIHIIGAGDVKIVSLIFAYLGPVRGSLAVGCGFLIGGGWSFLKMLCQGTLVMRLSYFLAYIRHIYQTKKLTIYYNVEKEGYAFVVPLGFCLFLGTIISTFI